VHRVARDLDLAVHGISFRRGTHCAIRLAAAACSFPAAFRPR
jgi:hypothetical protein